MPKIEFFSEMKIDKNPEIIESFINSYWEIFIKNNNKSKELVFVKRSELVKNSKYDRRNCYKHLSHLLFMNIFKEEMNHIFPSSIIFKINKKTINPTKIIFNVDINKEDINKGMIDIRPSISPEKIRELTKIIKVETNNLYDFISIPLDMGEKMSFSTSFKISNLPKIKTIIGLWNQKNREIKEKEKKLFRVLNPNKDPFNHNGFIELRGDNSPLFELEKVTKNYVIAGWASKFWDKEKDVGIVGDYSNKEDTGTEMLFYDKNKNLLYKKKLVFPSSKEGIPLADMSSLIFTRKNYPKKENPDYIGYYDFKNVNVDLQHILNHLIVQFSKFKVSSKVKFIRFSTKNDAFLTIINIFPLNKLDIEFIKKRMTNLNNGIFVQDEIPPLKEYKIDSIDTSEFTKINKVLKNASYESGKKKQILLQSSINRIVDYSYPFNKQVSKLIKKHEDIEKITKMILAVDDPMGYMSYCMINCPKDLSKKVNKAILDNLVLYKKIITLSNKITPSTLGTLLQIRFSEPMVLFEKKDFSKLDKELEELRSDLQLIKYPFNKIRIIDTMKGVIKQRIERGLLSEKTKDYFEYLIELNNERIKIFNELALKTIECEDKKEFNKEYIINKYKVYENLATYYQYQNILYKIEYYKNNSGDKEKFEELKLMLENFKEKIL